MHNTNCSCVERIIAKAEQTLMLSGYIYIYNRFGNKLGANATKRKWNFPGDGQIGGRY